MTHLCKTIKSYECFRKEGEIGHLPVNYALRRQAPLVAIVSVVQLHPQKRCPVSSNPMFLSILHITFNILDIKMLYLRCTFKK